MADFALPLLILHGAEDALCALSGSEDMMKLVPSKDKTIKVGALVAFSDNGCRLSIYQKVEREQGAIMRRNCIGVIRKTRWYYFPSLIDLKIYKWKDLG